MDWRVRGSWAWAEVGIEQPNHLSVHRSSGSSGRIQSSLRDRSEGKKNIKKEGSGWGPWDLGSSPMGGQDIKLISDRRSGEASTQYRVGELRGGGGGRGGEGWAIDQMDAPMQE